MGQTNSFHVQLERDAFYPGQTVRGIVHVRLTESLDLKNLDLQVVGEVTTAWKESDANGTTSFSGKEQVVKGEQMLAGKGTIQPGDYSYPFDFLLPVTAPFTFFWQRDDSIYQTVAGYDTRAQVRYFVQAVGVKNSAFGRDLKSEEVPFTVKAKVEAKPTGPVTVDEVMQAKSCCFKAGELSGSLSLSTNAAAPGATVGFKAELTNGSSQPIRAVHVNLKQRVYLKGGPWSNKGHCRAFNCPLTKDATQLSVDQLQPGGRVKDLEGVRTVPGLGPGSLVIPELSAGLIFVMHYVEVAAEMGAFPKTFAMEAPLTIGTHLLAEGQTENGQPTKGAIAQDGEAAPPAVYSYPKLEAPVDWSPLTFKPASFKLA